MLASYAGGSGCPIGVLVERVGGEQARDQAGRAPGQAAEFRTGLLNLCGPRASWTRTTLSHPPSTLRLFRPHQAQGLSRCAGVRMCGARGALGRQGFPLHPRRRPSTRTHRSTPTRIQRVLTPLKSSASAGAPLPSSAFENLPAARRPASRRRQPTRRRCRHPPLPQPTHHIPVYDCFARLCLH